jgi:hypothetical protein
MVEGHYRKCIKDGRLGANRGNNVQTVLKETEYEDVDWIQMAQNRAQCVFL